MLQKLTSIQKFDIFGVAPAIHFNGGSKSYSHFGFVYTLITGAFVIWAIVFTSQDFVHRTNPNLVTTKLYGSTVEDDLVLNSDDFQLGFGIYDNAVLGNYFIDPTIYTITARMGLFNYYPDGTCILTFTSLNIEPCTKSSFDGNVAYYESQWCLSKHQDHYDKLYTRTEADSFIQIDFHFCNNVTSGGNCASEEVINTWITNSDVMTTFKQSTTIASNYKEPISNFYTDQWQGLLLDKTKSVKLMIDVVEFTSDDGWLFQSEETKTILNYNSISGDALQRREEGLFATFIIANSGNKVVYHRTYMKIQDVLAQVSGLAGAAALMLGLLAQPFAELKMYEKAVKEVYQVKVTKKDSSPHDNSSKSQQKTQSHKIHPVSSFSQISNSHRSNLDETVKNSLKPKTITKTLFRKTSGHSFGAKVSSREPEASFDVDISIAHPKTHRESNDLSPQDLTAIPQIEVEPVYQKQNYEGIVKGFPSNENEIVLSHARDCTNALSIDPEKGPVSFNNNEENVRLNSEIGYFEWLISPIRSSNRIKLLQKGKDEVNKYLDLLVLVKKMRDIDKFKACLMTEEEKILFENVQKPELLIYENKSRKNRQVEVQDLFNSYETPKPGIIEQIYRIVRNKRNKTQFGEKLLLLYARDKIKHPEVSDVDEISRDHSIN